MFLKGKGDQVWERQVPEHYLPDQMWDKKPFFSE